MRSLIRPCLWALAVAAGLGTAARAAEPEVGPVTVTLRAGAGATGSTVCVRDVASLSGGAAALRDRIGRLDLADTPKPGKPLSLLRELVAYRIQVAGIERDHYRVQGAAAVQVTSGPPSFTEEDVLQAASEALVERLALPPDDVMVSPVMRLAVPQLSLTARDELRLQAVPHDPVSVPGRVRIDVTVTLNGERIDVVALLLDVKVYQSVALAARAIEAGEVLGDDAVRFERRPVDAPGSVLTPKEIKAGQKARRALGAGQVIPPSAVEALNPENPVLVRQRDLVKVVAKVGSLRVTALAEAQQDGRSGDRVRVRNVDSKKELSGRVVGRGLVEVEY
jgi:flagella basal body P-ring formation protein FlgA